MSTVLNVFLSAFIFCVVPTTNAFWSSGDPVVLTTQNFDSVVGNADLMMVRFYQTWCGFCKKYGRDWVKASRALSSDGILAGEVDLDDHPALKRRFKVRKFPTIKVFRGGRVVVNDYPGPQTALELAGYLRAQKDQAYTKSSDPLADHYEDPGGSYGDDYSSDDTDYYEVHRDNFDYSNPDSAYEQAGPTQYNTVTGQEYVDYGPAADFYTTSYETVSPMEYNAIREARRAGNKYAVVRVPERPRRRKHKAKPPSYRPYQMGWTTDEPELAPKDREATGWGGVHALSQEPDPNLRWDAPQPQRALIDTESKESSTRPSREQRKGYREEDLVAQTANSGFSDYTEKVETIHDTIDIPNAADYSDRPSRDTLQSAQNPQRNAPTPLPAQENYQYDSGPRQGTSGHAQKGRHSNTGAQHSATAGADAPGSSTFRGPSGQREDQYTANSPPRNRDEQEGSYTKNESASFRFKVVQIILLTVLILLIGEHLSHKCRAKPRRTVIQYGDPYVGSGLVEPKTMEETEEYYNHIRSSSWMRDLI